ncbi:MAG: replication initiator protein [Microviridae sp.]|nr:MAG: replication initiator protein [Microviridae sp.]
MACFSPLSGYRARTPNANGRRPIVFNIRDGAADEPIDLACGRCIGCRLERSRQWAIRCVHEASLHENNCFITLTYNPASLPSTNSLVLKHFQDFMKRLRKKFGSNVRFFHCGEYGEVCEHCRKSKYYCECNKYKPYIGRPHYHACLFNIKFPDQEKWKKLKGNQLYTSEILTKLWGKGFCSIGELNFETAAYVARYITKKISGPNAEQHYTIYNHLTGEINKIKPEYITMSRRPGIASGWLTKFKSDIYPSDFVVHAGKKMPLPKFYNRILELDESIDFDLIKRMREIRAKQKNTDLGAARYAALTHHKNLVTKQQLTRSYEYET